MEREMHTPGPHTVEYQTHLGDPAYAIRAADGDLIAVGMLKDDAALFAAAPDMLAACQDAIRVFDDPKMMALWERARNLLAGYDGPTIDLNAMRAAIAKATQP